MKKTILGILLFLVQIIIASFYNLTIDLVCIIVFASLTLGFILYKYSGGNYKAV